MPELPEVEAVCRKLREHVIGKTIRAAKVVRPRIIHRQSADEFASCVAGSKIFAVDRRAKHIFLRLSKGFAIRVHLGMTGNLYAVPDIRLLPAYTRAYFEFAAHGGILFTDPRALGRIHLIAESQLERFLGKFGPEPLSEEFTAESFYSEARKSRQPAKIFLMDQNRIAGLGNIYAAEALFRARIHPARIMARLSRPRLFALQGAIVQVLLDAVQFACTAYSGPGQFSEAESFACCVYDRKDQPCPVCGRAIRRIPQGGRSTYYCPGCQK